MTRLILILAFLKVGGVLLASLLIDVPFPKSGGPYEVPIALDFLLIVFFSIMASVLLALGRSDARAISFGGCLLMVATSFCARSLSHLTAVGGGPLQDFAVGLDSLKLDIFIPYFLWRFIRDFPRVAMPPGLKLFLEIGIQLSAGVGVLFSSLGFIRALWIVEKGKASVPAVIEFFAPKTGEGIYYMLMMALVGIALVPLAWKARKSVGDERRRVRLLTASLLLGLGPVAIEVLCEGLIPGYMEWMEARPTVRGWLVFFLLGIGGLSIPVTTAYSVLVYRALELKLIARRALQYSLAKSSVLVLVAVPAVALCIYLYMNRSYRVEELFSGGRVLLLLSGIGIGAVMLRYRKLLLDSIDRRFFREQYDARQILTLLVERIRSINESASLANLVSREIDLALHLEGVSMMVLDPRSGMLADPRSRARRLDASSSLALLISNASDPLEVDLENPQSPLARLDEKERHWLVDSNFRLIVPILARDGSLLGMVGLGEKKSGLPFLKEDRQLLHAIASSAAWVLELEQGKVKLPPPSSWKDIPFDDSQSSELPTPAAEYAKECATCGTLYQSFTVFCGHCSRRLDVSHVPFILPGKFRFEKRIGVGGMGLVYSGADLALGRHVAIKTLRRVSPEDAMRLRREARTAAAVSHPHLAPVYGMETWQGTPMLVMELLEGGTLTQRIEREKRLSPVETVELGIAMTEALAHLHAADILHRDIKPSNIGYTRNDTPKLMDFGIARMMLDLRPEDDAALLSGLEDDSVLLPPTSIWGQSPGSLSLSQRQLAGTLSYLSPESLHGEPPEASFDLWSLAVVLYECLLGRKVFTGGDARQTMVRIKSGRVPEFSQVLPAYDGPLGDFFRNALHKNRVRRPGSAREMRHQLVALRPRVAALPIVENPSGLSEHPS